MTGTQIVVATATTAEELQHIIDTAPQGATLLLEAGSYVFDRTIVIARSDLTLLGAGVGETEITVTEEMRGQPVFQLGHALYQEIAEAKTALTRAATEGDTEIVLASDHGLQAGDVICLEQENTAAFFDEIGDTLWRKDTPLRTMMAEVVAVEGDRVTLSAPLAFDYDPQITSVEKRGLVENVTLGGFSLTQVGTEADASEFSNTLPDAARATAILVAGSKNSTLADIEIRAPASNGLTVDDSIGLTVSGLEVTGAHNKGGGGNGYALWLRNVYDSSFTELTLLDSRHAVVFGSYNTAIGNLIEVSETNRDINFHGGLDRDNVVHVQSSVREGDEQDFLGATLFFNPGTSYGAPTDPDLNSVTFSEVVGTVRADLVTAAADGATISTLGSADMVIGGAGNDEIRLGTGHDTVIASQGADWIDGGAGTDTIVFAQPLGGLGVHWQDDTVTLSGDGFTTRLSNVEIAVFDGVEVAVSELENRDADSRLYQETSSLPATVYEGGSGWQRVHVTGSGVLGDALEAVTYDGIADLQLIGNALANHVMGGSGDDWIEGRAGDDRLLGRGGDDLLLGGAGNDALFGLAGDDTLAGGTGDDTLTGGAGADLFLAESGATLVTDFSRTDGDSLLFNGAGPEANAALGIYLAGGGSDGLLEVREEDVEGQEALHLAWLDESITLLGVTEDSLFA